MLIYKASQHNLTMAFTNNTNNNIGDSYTLIPQWIIFQILESSPAPKKIYLQVRDTQCYYNKKQPRQTKNYKRYRQTQPRNRGTNHTLMRKGNTW